MKSGDVFTWKRTFTEKDIYEFALVSGDKGRHHMERDEQGRLMVQGLLTASIATKIGGDLNYIARNMEYEFIRPVFANDTVSCELTIISVEKKRDYDMVAMKVVYFKQNGEIVLRGSSQGIIRTEINEEEDFE
jgi:3-hydroxybutyryl-CoA dehydratase